MCHRLQLYPYGLYQLRLSFSRSYGYILPSSLTRVVPRTLGFSPRLPVSVLVRALLLSLEAFLDSVARFNSAPPKICLSITSRPFHMADLPAMQPTGFDALFHPRAQTAFCVTPSLNRSEAVQEFSPVVHRLCFSPRLRSRLTLGRRALPRNP